MVTSQEELLTSSVMADLPRVSADFAACTIIAKNYLPMARVLAESFTRCNPGCPFFVLLMDSPDGFFEPEKESFYMLEVRQLQIPNLEGLLFKYNVLEASTAVKPTLMSKLFSDHDIKKLLYLDPDILVLSSLRELSQLLDAHSIVLTPHITVPYPDDAKPSEHDILQAGSFNLGFIGLQNTPVTQKFLAWWERKVYHQGRLSFEENMFVDQRWIDLATAMFSDVKILRDPGYNVAYWNLHERRVAIEKNDVKVNGQTGYFFHFSGFNPLDTSGISKHQTRFRMKDIGDARDLFRRYSRLILENGWNDTRNWPYTYDFFVGGLRIPQSARDFYWRLGEDVTEFGNPFTWVDGHQHEQKTAGALPIRMLRDRPFGVNVAGYLASEKGVGEVVRSSLRIMHAAGIPYVANNFVDTGSLNLEKPLSNFSEENPYRINLINVNADQVPYFAEKKVGYLSEHYNIGFWHWELSSFPKEWCGSFGYLNEIWVSSDFTLRSVAEVSPVPVTCVPLAIDPQLQPSPDCSRESFGLDPETYVYLFFFDFHSFLERKNPLGLIRAFRQAFGERRDALLLMKSTHGDSAPEQLRRLVRECQGANIRIFDKVLSREATHSLMSVADCYVSLHRSEGFGLTMSEAMVCGKPVIATGYSGNLDFMTKENSFLVPYKLIEIERDHGPYKKGNVWADPNIEEASRMMLRVFEDRVGTANTAKRGQADVLEKLHPDTVARLVKNRLSSLGLATSPPAL